jgi:hypothetical protein
MSAATGDGDEDPAWEHAHALLSELVESTASSNQVTATERYHQQERKSNCAADTAYCETYDVAETLELVAAHLLIARPEDCLAHASRCAIDTLRRRPTTAAGDSDNYALMGWLGTMLLLRAFAFAFVAALLVLAADAGCGDGGACDAETAATMH